MCVLTLEHFCWEKLHKIILPQSADAMNKMEKSVENWKDEQISSLKNEIHPVIIFSAPQNWIFL